MPPQTSCWGHAPTRTSSPARRLVLRGLMPSLAHRRQKLPPLVQHSLGLFHRRHHLLHRLEDVLRPEVEAAIEALDRAVNFLVGKSGVSDGALLITGLVEQRIDRQEPVLRHVVEQLRTGVGRRERYLDRLAVHLARESDRFLYRLLILS